MIINKKFIVFPIIFFYLTSILIINSSFAIDFATNSKINSRTKQSNISGEFKVIILNQNGFYSDSKVEKITNMVETELSSQYTDLNFNLSIIDDSSATLVNELNRTFNDSNIQNLVIVGSIGQIGLFSSLIFEWSSGKKFQHIKNLALIDHKNTRFGLNDFRLTNVSVISFDVLQAGFISGVKSASLTTTRRIGLILDESSQVTFKDQFKSDSDFNTVNFVSGFVAGINYVSEKLFDNSEILMKTKVFNTENTPENEMNLLLQDFEAFGTDVVFNLQSKYDNIFITKSKELNIKAGIYGDNNSEATFSFIENTEVSLQNLVSYWNSSLNNVTGVNFQYNLMNQTVMQLSDYSYGNELSLKSIQDLVLNGSIKLSPLISKQQIVPGFEINLVIISFLFSFSFLRRKKKF